MQPKYDKEGYAIDNYSSTPEDAAKFEGYFNGYINLKEDYDGDFSEDVDEEEEEDYDACGCSDPGCPCGGIKRGWL